MKKFLAALFLLLMLPSAWAAYPEFQTCSLQPHTHPGGVCNAYGGSVPFNVRSWSAGPPNSIVFGCTGGTGSHPDDGLTCSTAQECPAGQVYTAATGNCAVPPPATCPPMGTNKGAGTEAYVDRLSINVCQGGCGFTAAGAMKAGDKYVAFGPFTATGSTCTASGGAGTNTTGPTVPDSQCSYMNPTTGKCEAACPPNHEYKLVPSGAMACVKPAIEPNPVPEDKSCPRGYMNIAVTGVNCSPTGGLGSTSNTATANCPAGQKSVSINEGAAYCVFEKSDAPAQESVKVVDPKTTVTNADGSTTQTGVTQSTNKDGSISKTTTATTTGTDGKVSEIVRVEVGKTPAGKDGKDSSSDDSAKNDFCVKNPHLTVCANSTVTGKGKDTDCIGDAIQCAVLKVVAKVFDDTPTVQSTLGAAVLAGNDPLAASLPTKTNGKTVALPSSLDGQGWLGGSTTCLADKSFVIQGQTVTIPFSSACDYLLALRYALMIVSLLFSFKMLSGVILRE